MYIDRLYRYFCYSNNETLQEQGIFIGYKLLCCTRRSEWLIHVQLSSSLIKYSILKVMKLLVKTKITLLRFLLMTEAGGDLIKIYD